METDRSTQPNSAPLPERIGNTPLVRLRSRLTARGLAGITLWPKPNGPIPAAASRTAPPHPWLPTPAIADCSSRQNPARRHQRQHRHRLGHARRGTRLSRPARPCPPTFQLNENEFCAPMARRWTGPTPTSAPTAPFAAPANWPATTPNASATSISTPTTPTGLPTTAPPAPRFGSRPPAK